MRRLLLSTVFSLALGGSAEAALFPYADGTIGNLNVTGGATGGLLANVLPFGYENAAVVASFINFPGSEAGFNGGWSAGVPAIAAYGTADTGAVFMEVDNQPPALTLTGATYDATHLFPHPNLTSAQIAQLKVRMFVITDGATPYESNVTGWAADGSSITVVGWAVPGGGNATLGQVPSGAGTTTAYVGVFNQFFTRNTVIAANTTSGPQGAGWVADEIDVVNNTGDYVVGGAPNIGGIGIFMIAPGWTHGTHTAQGSSAIGISGAFEQAIVEAGIAGWIFQGGSTYSEVFDVDNTGDIDIGPQTGGQTWSPCLWFHSSQSPQTNPDSGLCAGGGNPAIPYAGRIEANANSFTAVYPSVVPTDPGALPTAGNAIELVPGNTGLAGAIFTVGDTNGKLTISPAGSGILTLGSAGGSAIIAPATVSAPALPGSAGGGGLYMCVDTAGQLYKKAACP